MKLKTRFKTRDFEDFRKSREKHYDRLIEYNLKNTRMQTRRDNRDMLLKAFKRLEFEGGECPMCKATWKMIEFQNKICYGGYFVPGCECYIQCPACNTHLYEDQTSGILEAYAYQCTNCNFELIKEGVRRVYGEWPEKIRQEIKETRLEWKKPKKARKEYRK